MFQNNAYQQIAKDLDSVDYVKRNMSIQFVRSASYIYSPNILGSLSVFGVLFLILLFLESREEAINSLVVESD